MLLHHVLDLWLDAWRQHHARGEVIIVRYADDFVLGFREETDVRLCLGALQDRFAKFHLELHPEKTRLIEFGRYATERRSERGASPPETFDFPGFTHLSGTTRKGDFTIQRISATKTLRGTLKELKDKLKRKMHRDLAEVGSWLSSVFQGWAMTTRSRGIRFACNNSERRSRISGIACGGDARNAAGG